MAIVFYPSESLDGPKNGLKIQWALRPCEFDSRLRHQTNRAPRLIWAPFFSINPDIL